VRALLARTLLGACVVMTAASGCSDTQAGTPTAASSATSTTGPGGPSGAPSASNDHGAPRVANPLDATRFLPKPCEVLTATQLQALELPATGKSDTDSPLAKAAGPACLWQNSDRPSTVGVALMSGNKNGLSDTYSVPERWANGYFEPTEVDGYPAVFNGPGESRSRGTCQITVGISDTLAFSAEEQGRLKERSCDRAKQVASMVIQTIKSGG
jgi:hypothetical protein